MNYAVDYVLCFILMLRWFEHYFMCLNLKQGWREKRREGKERKRRKEEKEIDRCTIKDYN